MASVAEPGGAIKAFAERCKIELAAASVARMVTLVVLLRDRAAALGLISEMDRPALLERHVLDSLRAATAFQPEDRRALDLGSGAGLPGLVLAVALPNCTFLLLDPRRRAISFLDLAVERLGLENASVVPGRVEEIDEREMDVVTARAFATIERSWAAACHLLRPGGRLVYFAGRRLEDPEGRGRSLTHPEPPASVQATPVVESSGPLVIMSRRGGGC